MNKCLFLFFILPVVSEKIYNYYELAVQKWCSETYMIHGLWPQIDAESYPVYCEEVDYIEPDSDLLEFMQQEWKGCDDSLWSHEWEKHGSCMKSQTNVTENDFFNITLQLFNSYKYLLDENCNIKNDDCIMGYFDLSYNLLSEY